jgi:hypothetical protein
VCGDPMVILSLGIIRDKAHAPRPAAGNGPRVSSLVLFSLKLCLPLLFPLQVRNQVTGAGPAQLMELEQLQHPLVGTLAGVELK